MSQRESVTPEAALLRVLINGEVEPADIMRKIREWTQGQIDLDQSGLAAVLHGLETGGLIERRPGAPDKRTGEPHLTFTLTTAGRAKAVEILATSLTDKS